MALSDTPNKLESVWIQRNQLNQFYEQINVSGSDLIVYHSSSGELQADKIPIFAAKYGLKGADEKAKVSPTDTTSGYLSSKIVQGANISITIINPGANETMSIASIGGAVCDQATLATASIVASSSLYATNSFYATHSIFASHSVYASESLSSSYIYFNGQRGITRTPYTGINLGTTTVTDFLEEFFFPFISATISINNTTLYYETGSSQNIGINGVITANSETVFGSGSIRRNGVSWYTFTSASSYSTTDTGVSSSKTYETFLQVGNDGSPTLIDSATKTVTFLYPYIMGLSATAGLSGNALYTGLSTKSVTVQGTKSDSFVGTSTYIYFAFPASYGSLTSIKDPSNFEVLSSFEYSASVPVTSSGLTHNWQTLYKVYRLILQANPNGTYIFYH